MYNELTNLIELNELLSQESDEELEKELEKRNTFNRKRHRKIRNFYTSFW